MPIEQRLQELAAHIEARLPNATISSEIHHRELSIRVERKALAEVLRFLRDDAKCRFNLLCDICGVDYPDRPVRFEVVYNLLSMSLNQRIRIKVETNEDDPVPSATGIFSCAGWWEREAWDLFGIFFDGNADLRRILTDYGFEGHPMRKDFPLTGYVEVRYDEEQKRVVYEPVRLQQEFRRFDFLSPWEGMDKILPGDEKAGEQKGGDPTEGAKP